MTTTAYALHLRWPSNPLVENSPCRNAEITLFPGGSIILGRHRDADVSLVDAYASPLHAMIEIRGDVPMIIDLGSLNGTYVDGERINPATVLCKGDVITIGATVVQVKTCERPRPLLPVNADEASVRHAAALLVGAVMSRRADGRTDVGALVNGAWKALAALSPAAEARVAAALAKVGPPAPAPEPEPDALHPETRTRVESLIAEADADVIRQRARLRAVRAGYTDSCRATAEMLEGWIREAEGHAAALRAELAEAGRVRG